MLRIILYATQALSVDIRNIEHDKIRDNYYYPLYNHIEKPYWEIHNFLTKQIFGQLMPQYGDKVNMFEDNKIVTASELSFV